ncbi:MAG: signal recognition particle receptor subunit alpha [Nanoarchaeota archaeon]
MVLDKLGLSLKNTLKKIASSLFIDEKVINELVKDIQKALLQSDVNVQLVFNLTNKIKSRAIKEETPKNLEKKEHLINIVYEELVNFLGEEKNEIVIEKKHPYKIMLVGLFGAGKTSSAGKIAKYYQQRGYKTATMALDVHRPAAIDQLEQLSQKINVTCFSDRLEKDVTKIYKKFENEIKDYDLIILDTAGRDAFSHDLITEIKAINKTAKPDQNLLVINADTGQTAEKQAKAFHEAIGLTGVIVTKLDGTARGGGALTACAASGARIRFIGTGEKLEDIELFNPKGFVGRLLGMGDIEELLEKATRAIKQEDAEELGRRLLKGEFNFLDLYEQMQAMKKMGPLNKIVELVPGMSGMNIPREMLDVQDVELQKWKYQMQSMTKEELENPDILTSNRIERIARGSGLTSGDVRNLIKQYRNSKKLAKMIKGKDPTKLMKKFFGKLGHFRL